ncbi:MAG: HEAT repeat domain-containing protein, partial [Candidatus Angelobacter sp.]
ALAHLNAHLEDDRNSNEETLTIAASLLEASPNDTATVHKTLSVVGRRADPGLTSGVIRQLGLSKSRNREALAFLGASLSHADAHVRESSVDAISRLDQDIRAEFAVPLARIASDPNESEYARTQARTALQP